MLQRLGMAHSSADSAGKQSLCRELTEVLRHGTISDSNHMGRIQCLFLT